MLKRRSGGQELGVLIQQTAGLPGAGTRTRPIRVTPPRTTRAALPGARCPAQLTSFCPAPSKHLRKSANGSPGREAQRGGAPGLRTRITGQVRVRAMQAGQTRSCWCVGAWMCAHTPGKRASLVRTAAAPPFRLPCPPPRPPLYTFLFGLRLNPFSQ